MSTTLNLTDHLLARGRRYQELGRDHDALHFLTRLSGFRELPSDVAEEAQARLAEVLLRRSKFARARRHLAVALRHRPDSARYHYLMALAADADGRGDAERALEHYRRSLELDPERGRCREDYGLLLLRLGRTEEGLAALRQAGERAADDPAALGKLVNGLCLANRADEARDALRAALFRHPHDARFRKLWTDFQFQELRKRQELARRGSADGDDDPVLLPFVRVAAPSAPARVGGKIIRHDFAGPVQRPHVPRPSRLRDQRNAQ